MFNDLPQNNNTNNDSVKDSTTQKKGLLQSLHSLSFNDDDDDVAPVVHSEEKKESDVNLVNMADEVKASPVNSVSGPAFGPSFSMNPKPTATPFDTVKKEEPVVPSMSTPLYEPKPEPIKEPVIEKPIVKEVKPVSTPSYNLNDLADANVTFDTIESSLAQEMRKSIDSVKISAENIKSKANYELVTSFGVSSKEVVIFNTFLTKEMPYTSKNGKTGTQRVNFFGLMTEKGVYSFRVSSALTSKLEDALKFTANMRDDSIGLIGEGTARRFVLKLPSEDYGSNNVLYVPFVGELSKQNPDSFTGLDAVEVDMQFIEDLMVLAVNEVDAMLDYEKRRRANLKNLQDKTSMELKKASIISDKLSSLSL